MKKAIVLLSGGQDSSTALFWAKQNFSYVEAISFDYGQIHKIELKSAKKVAKLANVKHNIMKIKEFDYIKGNSLLDKKINIYSKDKQNKNLPSTFVPGRNILFLTIAASLGYTKGIFDIVIGVSEVDYSGYPDCRKEFIKSMEKSLSKGLDKKIKIHTPLINKNKKEIVLLAKRLNIIEYMAYTHTCYKGSFPPCGKCKACKLREKGFKEAGIIDPLILRIKRKERRQKLK